jgi:hypothetical protein
MARVGPQRQRKHNLPWSLFRADRNMLRMQQPPLHHQDITCLRDSLTTLTASRNKCLKLQPEFPVSLMHHDYVTLPTLLHNIDLQKKISTRIATAVPSVGLRPGAWMSFFCSVCCHVQVSVMDRSLVQRIPIKCGVYECDRKTSEKRSRHTTAVELWKDQ